MKNYFKIITDTKHPKHLKYMAITLLITLLVLLPIIQVRTLKNDFKSIDAKYNELETTINNRLELLDKLDIEQTELINQLTINLSDHNGKVIINFDKINMLQDELNELKISKDAISETSFYFIIDEIYEELERLK